MSKYYKLGKSKLGFNVPVEVAVEDLHMECNQMEQKAEKKHLHFASWMIPGTTIRVFGLVETNTIYGFNMD